LILPYLRPAIAEKTPGLYTINGNRCAGLPLKERKI